MRLVSNAIVALSLFATPLPVAACQDKESASMTQTAPPEDQFGLDAAVGQWTLSQDGSSDTCIFALNRLASPGGYGVQIELCSIAGIGHAVSWRPTDRGFELLDTGGAVVGSYRQTGVDAFESADGTARLERTPLA
jgi:hypothetical protein